MTRSVPIHSDLLAVEERLNFFDYDREGLEEFFLKLEEPSFRARQVLQWMYHRRVTDIGAMTDLSLALRRRLKRSMSFDLPVITQEQESIDGTRKWLLQLADGNGIETVFIPEENRKTLCVSSQAGCALNCAFCATARLGFSRNLTAAEIIGQLWLAEQMLNKGQPGSRSITNVVMMGMGEPLLNYSAVVTAMRLMLDDLSFGLSRRRVTLSTAGLEPKQGHEGTYRIRMDWGEALPLDPDTDGGAVMGGWVSLTWLGHLSGSDAPSDNPVATALDGLFA